MAFTSTRIVGKSFTDVDTSALMRVGERVQDESGNEYIYLQGVASCAAGSWVTYDEAGVTTLLAANAIGPVAVAMAATVASTYGWFKIFGTATAKVAASFADNGHLYATATAGTADDAVVSGDRVKCALGRSAESSGSATVQLWYPFMDDGTAV